MSLFFRRLGYLLHMIMNIMRQKFSPAIPVIITMDDKTFANVFMLPFKTVIDIGAHAGEFTELARRRVPDARVFAFEPLPGAFAVLQSVISAAPTGSYAYPFALGDSDASLTMTEYPFTPCSSLLKAEKGNRALVPYMAFGTRRAVRVRRLDDVLSHSDLVHPVLMKIDVQGYEDRVLRGAEKILGDVDVLIIETSFVSLYAGQLLHADVRSWLERHGFLYSGCVQQHRAFGSETVMQEDSLFIRTPISS